MLTHQQVNPVIDSDSSFDIDNGDLHVNDSDSCCFKERGTECTTRKRAKQALRRNGVLSFGVQEATNYALHTQDKHYAFRLLRTHTHTRAHAITRASE